MNRMVQLPAVAATFEAIDRRFKSFSVPPLWPPWIIATVKADEGGSKINPAKDNLIHSLTHADRRHSSGTK
jgi:hypothetical protein